MVFPYIHLAQFFYGQDCESKVDKKGYPHGKVEEGHLEPKLLAFVLGIKPTKVYIVPIKLEDAWPMQSTNSYTMESRTGSKKPVRRYSTYLFSRAEFQTTDANAE